MPFQKKSQNVTNFTVFIEQHTTILVYVLLSEAVVLALG